MKRIFLMVVGLLSCAMLFGCGKKDDSGTSGQEGPREPETVSADNVSADGRERKDGKVRSFLTGEWVDEAVGTRRPVSIMLSNVESALPMCGISKADVVYECVVEGSLTRLMGVFEDYDSLEKIGSVRSCRDYFVYYALEFDSIYAHYGQASYAIPLLEADFVDNLSGLSGIGSTVFYRTSDRPNPHNAYASAEGIKAGIDKMGYRNTYREGYTGKFMFAPDGQEVNLDGEDAKMVQPGYFVNKPWFEYNESDGQYDRFQFGDKQIDEMTGEQLSYKNIIFQYSTWQVLDDNDYLAFNCHMGGEMKYFTNGKVIDGYWMRHNGDLGPIKYYDMNLDEIVVNPGKTWVCIIQDTYADKVVIK